MGRPAAAGGGEHGVVGERRRGDVEQRDGGEEEEQEPRRRQCGAARARVVAAAPPRLDHVPRPEGVPLRGAARGRRCDGAGETVLEAAVAAWEARPPLDQWLFELRRKGRDGSTTLLQHTAQYGECVVVKHGLSARPFSHRNCRQKKHFVDIISTLFENKNKNPIHDQIICFNN